MVIYRFFAAAAAALALPGAVAAEPLDLAGAMARARAGAREVVAADARREAAGARAKEAFGHRLPKLRLSEQWLRTDSPADAFGLLLNQERFSFQEFVAGDPNDPDALSTAVTRLEIELPLYTGGELVARVEQARLAAAAAESAATRAGDAAALAAAEAWIRLAQAEEAAALLETSRQTVDGHVRLARDYAAQGMIVRSELLRAEVELAAIDDALAEARGRARVAAADLAFRLGEPPGGTYVLAALGDPPALDGGPEGYLESAESRPDLEGARGLLEAADLEAEARRAAWKPRVGLIARHDRVDDRLFGGHGDSTTVAALASFDLFDAGRRARIAAARADAEAGRADVERFADGVRVEVRQAFEAAAVALERRGTARAALEAGREAVRIVQERFRAGVVRTLDVLDAAAALREAEMRELVARSEAWRARLALSVAAGRDPESALAAASQDLSGALR
jgi:outer membrane protein TolC